MEILLLTLVSINTALLECDHACQFYITNGHFCAIVTELSMCNRDCVARKAYDVHSLPFVEKVSQ
jgi:hypothetical protein